MANHTKSDIVIGIDLGTTYSCIGICKNKKVEIVCNESSNQTTPSYVAFTEDGQRLIGDPAKDQLTKNPNNTIYNIKRIIGRNWNDEIVQKEIGNVPFKVVKKKGKPMVEITQTGKNVRRFSPEEISSMILKRLVKTARAFINKAITNVVITVPAYFTDAQRQATINAGKIAGLNVLKLLNEPTAAAIAYGANLLTTPTTILVYDLGGGTFDVSILKIENAEFTVLSTCGNTHLGGEDFDQNVVNYFINLYKMKYNKDIGNDNRVIQRLRKEVERAKRALTHEPAICINIDAFIDGVDFCETLTRAKFEELNKDLFNDTLQHLQRALDDAQLTKEDVDEIIMVGGSSHIPKIRCLVKDFFNGKEPYHKINPNQAVAYGAAVYAGILSGQHNFMVLLDVNPLSLGIENSNNTMSIIIPRNTILPVRKTEIRTTSEDYQTTAEFGIYEGELPLAEDNLFLGQFTLTNIERALKGVPRFTTTFEIDENGILQVSAQDEKTKEKIAITIDWDKNRPTEQEIEEMIKITEEYDKLDEKFNESIDMRLEFSELVYSERKNLENLSLNVVQKDELKSFIEENIKWLKENKICEIAMYKERKENFLTFVNTVRNEF